MIQRKQSLFLLIAGLLSIAYFFFPFSVKIFDNMGTEIIYKLTVYGVKELPSGDIDYNYTLMFEVLLTGLICLIAVFLFENRNLQINISYLAILSTLGVIITDYIFSDSMGSESGDKSPVYLYSTFIPFVQFILIRLAISGIKKTRH